MSVKISLKKNTNENRIKNFILFSDENFKILGLDKISLSKYSSIINKTISNNKLKEKKFLLFNLNSSQRIILVRLDKNQNSTQNEKIGAEFYIYIKSNLVLNSSFIGGNIKEVIKKNKTFLDEFFHGLNLKSYDFTKYKTKKDIQNFNIEIITQNNSLNYNQNKKKCNHKKC